MALTNAEGIPPQLPGYAALMRLVNTYKSLDSDFKPTFSSLECMNLGAAIEFLEPKLAKSIQRPDPDDRYGDTLEIVLGFASMCVLADREERESLATPPPPAEPLLPPPPAEEGDEDDIPF
jgi:hypothetical protein